MLVDVVVVQLPVADGTARDIQRPVKRTRPRRPLRLGRRLSQESPKACIDVASPRVAHGCSGHVYGYDILSRIVDPDERGGACHRR